MMQLDVISCRERPLLTPHPHPTQVRTSEEAVLKTGVREREMLAQTYTKVQYLTEKEMPLADFNLDEHVAEQVSPAVSYACPSSLAVSYACPPSPTVTYRQMPPDALRSPKAAA